MPDFAYAGEVALGVVLTDPSGELARLQIQTQQYPPLLAEALVAGLWEASFAVDNARKAVARGDTVYVAGCLFRALALCAHALHGHAGRWLVNEKGAVSAAARLAGAPADFATRAQGLLARLGQDHAALSAAVARAEQLVADTRVACTSTRRRSTSPGRAEILSALDDHRGSWPDDRR